MLPVTLSIIVLRKATQHRSQHDTMSDDDNKKSAPPSSEPEVRHVSPKDSLITTAMLGAGFVFGWVVAGPKGRGLITKLFKKK